CVNQVEIALATLAGVLFVALLGVTWSHWRIRRSQVGGIRAEACRMAFEQYPYGILMVDAQSLRVPDANGAIQRTLGFTLAELLKLDLPEVFADESEDRAGLLRKLQNPNPRVPLQIKQRCRDGSLLNLETQGHRINLGSRQILLFTTDDVTLRRRVEAHMLERNRN